MDSDTSNFNRVDGWMTKRRETITVDASLKCPHCGRWHVVPPPRSTWYARNLACAALRTERKEK